mgnify:CR=1 FL=1
MSFNPYCLQPSVGNVERYPIVAHLVGLEPPGCWAVQWLPVEEQKLLAIAGTFGRQIIYEGECATSFGHMVGATEIVDPKIIGVPVIRSAVYRDATVPPIQMRHGPAHKLQVVGRRGIEVNGFIDRRIGNWVPRVRAIAVHKEPHGQKEKEESPHFKQIYVLMNAQGQHLLVIFVTWIL